MFDHERMTLWALLEIPISVASWRVFGSAINLLGARAGWKVRLKVEKARADLYENRNR